VTTSPTVTKAVTGNSLIPAKRITTPRLDTRTGSQLLMAFVSAGHIGRQTQSVQQVEGGGLRWTRVERRTSAAGTTEVWQAYSKQPFKNNVTARLSGPGTGAVTVGAAPSAGNTVAAGGNGRTASVRLPVKAGSLAWAVGFDPRRSTSGAAGRPKSGR